MHAHMWRSSCLWMQSESNKSANTKQVSSILKVIPLPQGLTLYFLVACVLKCTPALVFDPSGVSNTCHPLIARYGFFHQLAHPIAIYNLRGRTTSAEGEHVFYTPQEWNICSNQGPSGRPLFNTWAAGKVSLVLLQPDHCVYVTRSL